MKRFIVFVAMAFAVALYADKASACTGISLTAQDGSKVVARTVEWAATPMQCGYVVAPRGHMHQSYTPTGENGLKYKGVYGYVGIYTEYEPFVVEGVNEAGLSAGLFFFPQYGEYAPYNSADNDKTICDMQFVSWVLSQCSTIDQVKEELSKAENKGKGAKDIFEAITKDSTDIFKNPQQTKLEIPPTGDNLGADNVDEARMRAVMGLPPLNK
jgi:choloylglycine hydrolase